jgi:mycofactocin system creatininase family protein
MVLGTLTWPDIAATRRGCVLAVPVGSLEQHGPHLPLNTDTRIAVALTERLATELSHVVAAPAVPYGASGEHAAFPGTLLISHTVMAALVVELVRSARDAFRGVVLISAHGGNHEGLAVAEAQCREDGDDLLVWSTRVPGGDAHAGRTETSLMLAIDPGVVRVDLAEAGCTEPLESILPRLRTSGVRPVSSNGVLGDPEGANETEGRSLLETLTADLCALVLARWPVPVAAS